VSLCGVRRKGRSIGGLFPNDSRASRPMSKRLYCAQGMWESFANRTWITFNYTCKSTLFCVWFWFVDVSSGPSACAYLDCRATTWKAAQPSSPRSVSATDLQRLYNSRLHTTDSIMAVLTKGRLRGLDRGRTGRSKEGLQTTRCARSFKHRAMQRRQFCRSQSGICITLWIRWITSAKRSASWSRVSSRSKTARASVDGR